MNISLVLRAWSSSSIFSSLGDFCPMPLLDSLSDISDFRFWFRFVFRGNVRYVLELSTDLIASLSEVMSSAFGLLRHLQSVSSSILVVRRLLCDKHGQEMREQHHSTCGNMVDRCFFFLSDIFFHSPRQAALDAITEVYIDEHGIPVYATIQNSPDHPEKIVRNSRAELALATICNMVKCRMVKFKKLKTRFC
jgi:hypothetical protein